MRTAALDMPNSCRHPPGSLLATSRRLRRRGAALAASPSTRDSPLMRRAKEYTKEVVAVQVVLAAPSARFAVHQRDARRRRGSAVCGRRVGGGTRDRGHHTICSKSYVKRRGASGGRAMRGSLGETIGEGVYAEVRAWAPGSGPEAVQGRLPEAAQLVGGANGPRRLRRRGPGAGSDLKAPTYSRSDTALRSEPEGAHGSNLKPPTILTMPPIPRSCGGGRGMDWPRGSAMTWPSSAAIAIDWRGGINTARLSMRRIRQLLALRPGAGASSRAIGRELEASHPARCGIA